MAVGATEEIEVTIDLLPSQPVGTVHNSVEVDASSPDPDPSNNADEAATEVSRPGGQLPATGADTAGILRPATALVTAGGLLLLIARRRRVPIT